MVAKCGFKFLFSYFFFFFFFSLFCDTIRNKTASEMFEIRDRIKRAIEIIQAPSISYPPSPASSASAPAAFLTVPKTSTQTSPVSVQSSSSTQSSSSQAFNKSTVAVVGAVRGPNVSMNTLSLLSQDASEDEAAELVQGPESPDFSRRHMAIVINEPEDARKPSQPAEVLVNQELANPMKMVMSQNSLATLQLVTEVMDSGTSPLPSPGTGGAAHLTFP